MENCIKHRKAPNNCNGCTYNEETCFPTVCDGCPWDKCPKSKVELCEDAVSYPNCGVKMKGAADGNK